MTVLNFNHRELTTKRFALLVRCMDGREDVALGLLTKLWLQCLTQKVSGFAPDEQLHFINTPIAVADAAIKGLVLAGYLKWQGDWYEAVDVAPWVARAHIRLERATKAGLKSAKVRAKKRLAIKKLERAQAALVAPEEDEAAIAARACWAAYANAYERLFHAPPVRNVKVNSLIKQFVKRIPTADAPHVLRFYVGHGHSFYAQRMYPLDLAVKDAEGLHTQWRLNRPITKATIDKFNQREKMRDALEEGVIF